MVRDNPARSCLKTIYSISKEALDSLDKIYNQITEQIVKDDNNLNTAILKIDAAYSKLHVAQNSYAVSCYERSFLNSNKGGKITVQPAPVPRRVKKRKRKPSKLR